jgi:predicted DNA-binding protein (MmcQ/YjbR family)
MKYQWLDKYCKSKQGTEKDFKEEWNATRYMLKGKMFAMQGNDKSGKAIITLKLEPSHGQLPREEHQDIFPRYYMNKEQWDSNKQNPSHLYLLEVGFMACGFENRFQPITSPFG